MSDFDLRDWAVGDKITAASQQAVTDHLRRVSPLSFSGNVRVSGSTKHGMAVYVPPTPGNPGAMPLLRLTGDAAGNGAYIAQRLVKPSGSISASASVTNTNLGEMDGVEVVVWNLDEQNEATHWLTDPANVNKTDFQALSRFGVDDSGREIFIIDSSYSAECEEAP